MNFKCLPCCGEMVQAKVKSMIGERDNIPEPEDAITMAPSWQQQTIGNQMVMACVAVPVCEKHLAVAELSPAEQAIRNGRLLQGTMG